MNISLEVLIILRDSLREKGKKTVLSEAEYNALLHTNALIQREKIK